MAKYVKTDGPVIVIGDRRVSGSFRVKTDYIDVTSDRPTVDPNWRHTDSNGHEHYYDNGYPTLDYIIDERHWCDGREGLYNHDPHWAVDEDHFECLTCREMVKPGTLPAFTPQSIPGTRSMTVTVNADVPLEESTGEVDGTAGRFLPVSRSFDAGRMPTVEFEFVPS